MRTWTKTLLFVGLITLYSFAGSSSAQAQGWSNGYARRRTITVDHTKVPNTDQTNFPVLVSGTFSDLATTTNGGQVTNANGYDIIFTSDANGANLLPFEQESYNSSNGAVVYWIKVPTLSHNLDTVFYLFYGKSSVSTDQSNKTAVWDSNYKGVWHLPNGSSLTVQDSTSNGNNGTVTGATATSGQIDGAASFSGSGQYIDLGSGSSLSITGSALTLDAWVKTSESNPSQWERLVVKETQGNTDPYAAYNLFRWGGTNRLGFAVATGGAGSGTSVETVASLSMGAWTHIVGTYDGANLKVYVNGNLDSQVSKTGNIIATTPDLVLGWDTNGGEYFNGSLDEVRISNVARSADWIAAEYNNQSAPASFSIVGSAAQGPSSPMISRIAPTTANYGTTVSIQGANFGTSQGSSTVSLNGTNLVAQEWSDTGIFVNIPFGATSGTFTVTVNGHSAVSPTLTVKPLPYGWSDGDIGNVGVTGSASYTNGTFTVSGAGEGINNAWGSDAFHFVYQTLSGDGTIVARVASIQGGTAPQAGVMIRQSLDPADLAAETGSYSTNNSIYLNYRTSYGANPGDQSYGNTTAPFWIKLVRSGSTFSGYTSEDGVNWFTVGSQTVSMSQNVDVGLLVASYNTSSLTTATIDSVSVSSTANPGPVISSVSATTASVGNQVTITGTGFGASQNGSLVVLNNAAVTIDSWTNTSIIITIPSGATSGPLVVSVAPSMNDSNAIDFTVTSQPLPVPWLDQDVGSVGLVGSATYSNGTFTVKGAGIGTTNTYTVDAFHFVYQPLSGDGTISARIVSASGGTPTVCVMIRETLGQSSTHACTNNYGGATNYLSYRTSTGGVNSSDNYGSASLPTWVKLVRTGSTFTGYTSSDGVSWTQGSSHTISMAQNVYVGLAVSSYSTSVLDTATYDNVTVQVGTSPFVTGVSPNLGPVSTSVTITGSNFGATQGTSTVSFNGVQAASVTSWNATQIVATVASSTPAGPGPVTVTVNSVTSPGTVNFTTVKPAITSLTPPAGTIGGTITVAGTGFGTSQGSSKVLFNGTAAGVTSWSNTSITAVVPSGATSGPVTVVEDGVTTNSVQFTVLEALSVTGISPTSGPKGTSVTITGTGFGATQSNSTANFYNLPASSITSWSDTQIVAVVQAGTATGPTSVTVASLSAYGPSFTVTSTLTLTDSLSNQTTYASANIGGKWVSSSAQGSGCSSCTIRGTISYTYDTKGDTLSRTDENGHTTTYTYDSNGNVLSVTVPINSSTTATTSYTYNSFGEVLTTTDPLGNVTTNTYDANGNLLTVTTPPPAAGVSASVTTFTYDSKGELQTIKDPLNNVTTLAYYSTGLINTITDAQNNVTTYGYDTHGNRTSVTDALNHQTTFTYDSMERLTKITYPDTTTTQFGYDYRGRRTSVTDQNGKVTTYAYDDADRLTSVTDAANNVTTYGYDTESNLTSIKDANNHTTSFTYDAFGRVTKTTFPSGNFETYGYDSVGNLTGKTDRKNQLITYTYDQLNRLTEKLYPDNSTVNYTYDLDSRMTQVTDPTGTYQFTFDNMGRLTNTTTSYAFLTGRNFTTSYGYDAASNRTGFTDPESGATSYVYDTLNRLQTLTPPAAFVSSGNFGFSYDALSRRTQMTRPNGLKSVYAYDNLSHLQSILHQSGSTTLDGSSYGLDNAGNRTSRTPQPSGTASNYSYDNIYELTGVTQGSTTTESYTYDPVGNRLSSLGVSSYTNNSSNELTSTSNATYTYDNNGNTLTKVVGSNTTTYAWDFENRLTSVTLPGSGGTVSFAYDPFGRRIKKVTSSTTSIFAYDGDNLVEETNSSGTAVARYAGGLNIDEPLAMLRSSTTSYYHADGLGSITSLSSSAGSIANTYTYDSFGNLTASTGSLVNPFRYTARESDTETSLYYYRARYYDPTPGRFVSEDPIGFHGGENFYRYAENGPINRMDASGLAPNDGNDPNAAIIAWWRLFGPKASCPESKCSVSVSCLPTHGLQFTHCTVKTWDGSGYTDFDGMPQGSNVFWTKLEVQRDTPHRSAPPGPNTFFSANVPCDCVQKEADKINKGGYRYSAPLQNSNTAAQMMVKSCGVNPTFPFSAWGARPW